MSRIVAKNIALVMPETATGFKPDVSGMHWLPRLPRLPNNMSICMALTGYKCNLYECLYLKLATYNRQSTKIDKTINEIKGPCDNDTITCKK